MESDQHARGARMDRLSVVCKETEDHGGTHGTVVVYSPDERGYVHSHERITHFEIARRLAVLKGFDFAGEYEPSSRYAGPLYFVPTDTLVGVSMAADLRIHSEQDLFGGVVPFPFVATKSIAHPLIDLDAYAPIGWSRDFERRVHDATLAGFSAFTIEDARRAGARLLDHGPVRIKPARASGGRGQLLVSDLGELEAALGTLEPAELSSWGLVLEENLTKVLTYSVGQVRVAELVASYWGTQNLTPDHSGAEVYGGSDLVVVRGDFEALLRLDLPQGPRLAATQACVYADAAMECFPGLLASRRNYDIAQGQNAEGQWRCGVLEQSWRIGGATCAEVAALQVFRADTSLHVIRASCVEIFGNSEAPPGATVYFCGTDEQVGPITKYTMVEPYVDAR